MFSGKCCTCRNTTTSLHTTEKVYQLRFLPTTGGAVSLLRFIVNLVMEQLSVLGCYIINLIFTFSSCENLVSLISHTSPLATLSRAHLSARTCFGQMLLLFLLDWNADLHSDESVNITRGILHILAAFQTSLMK